MLNQVFISFFRDIQKIKGHINFLTENIEEIRFNITAQCNIRCEYCYVDFQNRTLDKQKAKNIIDFYIAQPGDKKIVSFFG
jgi:sulfatase maturation enzyme AslB (radical SAM superfamily)